MKKMLLWVSVFFLLIVGAVAQADQSQVLPETNGKFEGELFAVSIVTPTMTDCHGNVVIRKEKMVAVDLGKTVTVQTVRAGTEDVELVSDNLFFVVMPQGETAEDFFGKYSLDNPPLKKSWAYKRAVAACNDKKGKNKPLQLFVYGLKEMK